MILQQENPALALSETEIISPALSSPMIYPPVPLSFQFPSVPTRKVPGRKGMTWEEEDWVDEDAVSHRGMDD